MRPGDAPVVGVLRGEGVVSYLAGPGAIHQTDSCCLAKCVDGTIGCCSVVFQTINRRGRPVGEPAGRPQPVAFVPVEVLARVG